MGNYYCLMAGAPGLEMGARRADCTLAEFKDECLEALSEADRKLLYIFFLRYDCLNLVAMLQHPEAEINPLGNLDRNQLIDLMTSAREINFNVHRYPSFMSIFAREYAYKKDAAGYFPHDAIMGAYLEYAARCSNKMMARWYALNRDILNILTAMIARKNGWNVADYLQGENEVNEMILTNNTRDFDLSTELDYVKDLMQIVDETDPVQKERRIDALRWEWLDEATFFNPFGIEAVFAYLCKLEMLQRWEQLDPEQGRAAFERIIDSLRSEAQVPAEFVR